MKSSYKSPQEAELLQRKINTNLVDLHKVFSTLFPITVSEDNFGKRLTILMKARISRTIDRSKVDRIYDLIKIKRKTNKRQYVDSIFSDLLDQGLLEETDKPDLLTITNKGRALLSSLEHFIDLKEGTGVNYKITKGLSYFEYLRLEIETDGKKTHVRWNWKLVNQKKEPIEKINVGCGATVSLTNDLNFNHSKTIKRYNVTVDDTLKKRMDLIFKEPIKKGQSLEYWYEYDWDSMHKNGQGPWDFTLFLKKFPAREVIIIYKLNKEHKIKEETCQVDYNIMSDNCLSLGEYVFLPTLIKEFDDHKELKWHILNLPTFTEIKIAWDHET